MCVNDVDTSGCLFRRTKRCPYCKAQQKGYSAWKRKINPFMTMLKKRIAG